MAHENDSQHFATLHFDPNSHLMVQTLSDSKHYYFFFQNQVVSYGQRFAIAEVKEVYINSKEDNP